ncbi:hypothetical protein BDZ89DRAFT_1140585 [Hymenopellis radicata]|nr:hypothetical protein BDZ89DRAFT_1140585 [Hymenopellis radicata]
MTADSALFSSGVSTLETILHPIRALPLEIIGRICEHALEDFAIESFEGPQPPIIADSLSMRHPSWTFSHVCQKWREGIQGHALCWSHVILSLNKPVSNPVRLSLLLADVLRYAGNLKLSILIESPKLIPSNLMSGILPSCRRWRRASLFLTLCDFRALSEMKHSFAALEMLYVDIPELPFTPTEGIDTFAEAPRLGTFVMTKNVYFVFQLPRLRLRRVIHRGINSPLSGPEARAVILNALSLTSATIVLKPEILAPSILPPSRAFVLVHSHCVWHFFPGWR